MSLDQKEPTSIMRLKLVKMKLPIRSSAKASYRQTIQRPCSVKGSERSMAYPDWMILMVEIQVV